MKPESWIKQYWRPFMAYQYLFVCLADFLIFPILTGLLSYYSAIPYIPWDPITLKEGGFYHLSMAAIIGVAAWTRGQEKMRRLDLDTGTIVESETNTSSQTPTSK